MAERMVSIVFDDPDLYDSFLKEFPGRIRESQIHIDDSGERDDVRPYWISGLFEQDVLAFLATRGSGNYALYPSKIDGKQSNLPLKVHKGLSRLAMG